MQADSEKEEQCRRTTRIESEAYKPASGIKEFYRWKYEKVMIKCSPERMNRIESDVGKLKI